MRDLLLQVFHLILENQSQHDTNFVVFTLPKVQAKLYPVSPFLIMPNFSNLIHFFLYYWLLIFTNIVRSDMKNGLSSLSLSFTSKYGHVPISSLRLNAWCIIKH